MRRALSVIALTASILSVAPASGALAARFDTRLFALIPTPGFPARAYAAPNGRVYEGTYDNPSGDHVASRVLEYTGDGALLRRARTSASRTVCRSRRPTAAAGCTCSTRPRRGC